MALMMRKIYQGLYYRPEALRFNPLVNSFVLLVQFALLLQNNLFILTVLLLTLFFETCCYRNLTNALSLLRAALPLIVILIMFTLVFGSYLQTITVVCRFLIGICGFSLFFAVTNPSEFAQSLEMLHIPTKWAILPALMLAFIPRTAKDAEDSFETLALRGEIRGSFFHWLPKVLAIYIASVKYRSEFLARSLYYRGLGVGRRSHYKQLKMTLKDFFRIMLWILVLIAFFFLQ